MSDWMEQSGERNEQIQVMKRVLVTGTGGATITNWPIVDTLWAKRHQSGGSEKDMDGAEVAEQRITWHVNYYEHEGTVMNPAQFRLRQGNYLYDIIEVREIGFRKVHELRTIQRDIQDFPEVLELHDSQNSYLEQQQGEFIKVE
jgi:head-tail adaptor